MRELFEQKVSRKHADNRCETFAVTHSARFAQFMGDVSAAGGAMRNKALPESLETRDIGTKRYSRPVNGVAPFRVSQDTPES
jgi:hypothetical protein